MPHFQETSTASSEVSERDLADLVHRPAWEQGRLNRHHSFERSTLLASSHNLDANLLPLQPGQTDPASYAQKYLQRFAVEREPSQRPHQGQERIPECISIYDPANDVAGRTVPGATRSSRLASPRRILDGVSGNGVLSHAREDDHRAAVTGVNDQYEDDQRALPHLDEGHFRLGIGYMDADSMQLEDAESREERMAILQRYYGVHDAADMESSLRMGARIGTASAPTLAPRQHGATFKEQRQRAKLRRRLVERALGLTRRGGIASDGRKKRLALRWSHFLLSLIALLAASGGAWVRRPTFLRTTYLEVPVSVWTPTYWAH